MSIDIDAAKAYVFEEFSVLVERGRLRSFARAIGETDPVYTDFACAEAAGYRDIPAPPTFLFSLGLEAPEPFGYLSDLGIDLRRILHGEQRFDYRTPVCAGDEITLRETIDDVYSKRGGALEFLVKRTEFLRDNDLVGTGTTTIVVRHPKEQAR
nr:MaoC family dehydratase N-terminal domain-containing protein [Rhodococcus sp. (in: high G+C Gram-positive bacteria)]